MQSYNGKLAIIFFGIKDMSFDYYLKKSYQKYLETEIKINSIYDALVYYNCYLCLTSGFKLKELSKEEFSSIENWAETKVKIEVYKYISKNCLLFTEKDFSNLNYKYKEQFLDLCYKIGLIKNWSNSDFENLSSNFYVRILLGNKKIVEKFGVVIKKKLFELNNKELVGLYISTFQESINDPQQLSFPSEISTKEWEKQIEIFVQESTANDINTLTIISQLQSQKKINIPNKVKFEAKVKTQKFNDEILKSSKNFIKENIEVRLEKNQDRNCSLIKLEFKEGQLLIICNSTYLEATTSLPEILNNLSSVFSILDENQMLKIAQNPPDEGILALSRIKVKENYNPSDNFNRNFCISLGSFRLYYHFLKSKGIDLENIASQFFTKYIKEEFGFKGFEYNKITLSGSYEDRCKILAPKIENCLKQFNEFVKHGKIDQEYINSGYYPALNFNEITSLTKEKYYYPKDEQEINNANYLLFSSNNSVLFTPNKSQSKDLNLYQLINSIPIFYDDFEDYQKSAIDYLIKTNYLNNDSKLKTTPKAFFAYWIYKNGCINYFQSFANLTIKNRKIVSYDLKEDLKSSKKTGVYKTEDSLFSKQEQEFLNFILKNKFGDSWGLRNIYTHGAQKNSENDYLLLLYIQFCIILKINDDFCAKSYLDDEQS